MLLNIPNSIQLSSKFLNLPAAVKPGMSCRKSNLYCKCTFPSRMASRYGSKLHA